MRQAPAYSLFASVYDRLMGDHAASQVWRSFCLLCRRYGIRFRSVADIGCGTGTFLRQLWHPGLIAFGVDRSPAMLQIARRKNRHTDIEFLCQDVRRLQLPKAVDLITCNQDTLNYLLDQAQLREAFERCRENLAPGGLLVFDMIRGSDDDNSGSRQVIQKIGLPGIQTVWKAVWWPKHRTSVVRMTYRIRTGDGRTACKTEIHRQKWFDHKQTAALLQRTGFILLGMHDAATLLPVTRHDSWIKYVARKRSFPWRIDAIVHG